MIGPRISRVATVAAATVVALALAPGRAQAVPMLDISRISDTEAIVIGRGTLPLSSTACDINCHTLSIADPFGTAPTPTSNDNAYVSSSFAVGDRAFTFAFTAGKSLSQISNTPTLYIGPWRPATALTPGAALSGEMTLALTDSTFAPVGSTGVLYWGNGYSDQPVGTWKMTAAPAPVPEPASVALLGSGLCALFVRARRRRT